MLTIGMVVEGSHDHIMLQPFIEQEISRKFGEKIRLVDLQPLMDATGKYVDGGWSKVVAWCTRNSGEDLRTFFTPLFANQTPCDFIVIHLDGDAVELIGPHTAITIPPPPYDPNLRCQILEAAIKAWLAAAPDLLSKIAFATPVYSTEAWLIGAEQSHPNPEGIDAKTLFRTGHNFRREPTASFYRKKTAAAAPNVNRTSLSCSSYTYFMSKIDALTK